MDYFKEYENLIQKAQSRNWTRKSAPEYVEEHHIWPSKLGGPNYKQNLVFLTASEHYYAHYYLMKMFEENNDEDYQKMVNACLGMNNFIGLPGFNLEHEAKIYEEARKEYSKVASENGKQRIGEKNGSYGKSWYVNPETGHKSKYLPEEVPEGYIKGRSFSFCKNCGNLNQKSSYKTCSEECTRIIKKEVNKPSYFNEEYARKTFNEYINNDCYTSIRQFVKESNYLNSIMSLTRLWKTFIPEYYDYIKPKNGKDF